MQHYGHSLQPQGTKAGARTMDVVYPLFPHGNPMGMPRGHYPVAVGGFRCVMSGRMMRRCNVQGAVKCSGWNPNEKAYQKPNLDEVANLPDGSRIPVVYLPIMHRDFWKGAEPMIDFLRKIWLQGGTVFFFDDLGKDRCIAGLCYCLFRCTGVDAKEWLKTLIIPQREIDEVFYQLVHHYDVIGDTCFAPEEFRKFILAARIMNHPSGWAIFREAHPNMPYTPGGGLWTPPYTPGGRDARTPGGTDRNARRKEDQAGLVTPRDCQDPLALAEEEIPHYEVGQSSFVPPGQAASSSAGVVNPGTAGAASPRVANPDQPPETRPIWEAVTAQKQRRWRPNAVRNMAPPPQASVRGPYKAYNGENPTPQNAAQARENSFHAVNLVRKCMITDDQLSPA